jgi:hypothetical protein
MDSCFCKKYTSLFFLLSGLVLVMGCSDLPEKRVKVKGPWVVDSLEGGSKAAVAENGEFTQEGYKPGKTGFLKYSLPGLTQGVIEFDIKGLERNGEDCVFLTMYETPAMQYPEPFVVYNPYRVALSVLNFERHPASPFELVWTIKDFPETADTEQRYVQDLPQGVDGEVNYLLSSQMPVFPDKTYHIKLHWKNGIVRLFVDGDQVIEHNYQPLIYGADSVEIVFGKTPGEDTFGLPDAVFSNVKITYPEL